METDWKSIYVVTAIGFIITFRISAIASALWPYMKLINPTIEESYLGAMSSSESFGNVVVSLLAGYLSNHLADTKLCIIAGVIFYVCGALAYLAVELIPSWNKVLFMVMQTSFGLAVGLTSVSRTRVAMISSEKDRARAISIFTLALSSGMAFGPLLAIIAGLVPHPGLEYLFGLHFNVYTIPATLFLLFNIGTLIALVTCYNGKLRVHEEDAPVIKAAKPKSKFSFSLHTPYDKFAVVLCCVTRVVQTSSMLVLVNVGTPYMMTAFGWTSEQSVLGNALMLVSFGVLGIPIALLYMNHIPQRYLSDRKALLICVVLYLAFYVITFPYPFYPDTIPYEVFENGTLITPGCSSRFEWCATTPVVNQYLFFVAAILCMGIAFPLTALNVDVLYAKVLGNIKQGTMQGVFMAVGELTNIVGPLAYTAVYEVSGPIYLWLFNIVFIGIILAVWFKFYPRMISAARRAEINEKLSNDADAIPYTRM